MKTVDKEVLDLFKCMVVENGDPRRTYNTTLLEHGIVTNFVPSRRQVGVLQERFVRIPLRTLFSRKEVKTSTPEQLITKQFFHYLEVYGLRVPGLFDLEFKDGTVVVLYYVKGITRNDLVHMVHELLYRNAPVMNADALVQIIRFYDIPYDLNAVQNNEVRVLLFDVERDQFLNGDDAVRWICYTSSNRSLLIKSNEMISDVKLFALDPLSNKNSVMLRFLQRHKTILARVFNRHKPLLLALKKDKALAPSINEISRLSKRLHQPVFEHLSKSYVSKAVSDEAFASNGLKNVSVRDKMKFLGVIKFHKLQGEGNAYTVRNGKTFVKLETRKWNMIDLQRVENEIIESLTYDLEHLTMETILLDPKVDYGLPTSRKQTVGQLPFGTIITPGGDRISSGVFWMNDWGADDLDLSAIDMNGNRTGWGNYSGYDQRHGITFSGDITYAPTGAMEFMTSSEETYALYLNIFSGDVGCSFELVVGSDGDNRWIQNPIIREKSKLDSRNCVVGFVCDDKYVVWQGRIGNGRISTSEYSKVLISKALNSSWTIRQLLDTLDITYHTEQQKDVDYTADLSYSSFSYDKLERLLLK